MSEPQDELALDAAVEVAGSDGASGVGGSPKQKSITIGAVCKALVQEFPDISISKIRYLEDQKLLTPRRTPGAIVSTPRATSRACARSCGCSATSSCRCG